MALPMKRRFLVQSSSSRSKASTSRDRLMTDSQYPVSSEGTGKRGRSQCGGVLSGRSASHGQTSPQEGNRQVSPGTLGLLGQAESGTHGCLREPLES